MRILGNVVIMMFLVAGLASAATINLNDGRSVQGDIVKQDSKSLQVNVDGVTMTYYADEIKDVDGQPLGAAVPETVSPPAAAPAAVVVSPHASAPDAATTQPPVVTSPQAAPMASADTIDPDKKALILKFMDVFGTRQAMSTNFDLMLKQIAKDKPEEAQTIGQRVKIDEIIDRLLPIYDRNFSSDDLKAFIAFYGSPEGQKLIHTIPELMKESVVESVKYMQEKFPELNSSKQ